MSSLANDKYIEQTGGVHSNAEGYSFPTAMYTIQHTLQSENSTLYKREQKEVILAAIEGGLTREG